MTYTRHYPSTRMRRMRCNKFSRELMSEHHLNSKDLIYPMFVISGENKREPVLSMPGIERLSPDLLLHEAAAVNALGVPAIALFPVIEAEQKTPNATEAYNPEGLIPTTIRLLKQQLPELGVITDIALDSYTSHGQDGLIDEEGYVLNDETLEVLIKQAISHAQAGSDIVAPSDMMDGRVGAIRHALEQANFVKTCILAYSAKYASAFYGPFRDAVGSGEALGASSKETYQMDPANSDEALAEVMLDVNEGADAVMIKPAMPYLDVIRRIKDAVDLPVFAYQVSGEYAMLKAVGDRQMDERLCVLEALIGIKRAGANAILSYYAKVVAEWLAENNE